MTNFNIEIVSDPVCPWCYIGKKKLDKAIEIHQSTHPYDTFTRTWKPFYVKPHSPEKGVPVLPNLRKQYGTMMANMMTERVRSIGADAGINFKFEGKTGRTRDAHRLIQLGKTKSPEMQTRVVEELFASYWEGEADITSHEDLTKAGVKAGLDEAEVKEWLANDRGGKEVDAEAGMARVNGVPNYRVGKYTVSGAQDPGAFLKIFHKIKAIENGEPEGWGSCVGQ
ncbi:hypothetical protein UA08_09367 [Talaromyces atroroseus]|uniref:DSBA-like thioredoxin domain-containing protein n=1 Tax=Talaromyces atroroseus TaxID=1441469 RepID=A0A1Q5Q633_TALAT|nr:hypothetical protein UA08_09367 [Talaromyces atroroseus]OKL55326.1 hypothetical protein UA08_09367 [Talaromyces atroroseus]